MVLEAALTRLRVKPGFSPVAMVAGMTMVAICSITVWSQNLTLCVRNWRSMPPKPHQRVQGSDREAIEVGHVDLLSILKPIESDTAVPYRLAERNRTPYGTPAKPKAKAAVSFSGISGPGPITGRRYRPRTLLSEPLCPIADSFPSTGT
jgi:hypothetical protein